MKKLLFGLIALVSLVCFSSCSNDNEEGNNAKSNSIVGTWEYTESEDGMTYYLRMTFKSNGRFTWVEGATYMGEEDSETFTGEYECEDGYLSLYFDDGDYAEAEYEISNNKLYIYDDEGDYLVFKRK